MGKLECMVPHDPGVLGDRKHWNVHSSLLKLKCCEGHEKCKELTGLAFMA